MISTLIVVGVVAVTATTTTVISDSPLFLQCYNVVASVSIPGRVFLFPRIREWQFIFPGARE